MFNSQTIFIVSFQATVKAHLKCFFHGEITVRDLLTCEFHVHSGPYQDNLRSGIEMCLVYGVIFEQDKQVMFFSNIFNIYKYTIHKAIIIKLLL